MEFRNNFFLFFQFCYLLHENEISVIRWGLVEPPPGSATAQDNWVTVCLTKVPYVFYCCWGQHMPYFFLTNVRYCMFFIIAQIGYCCRTAYINVKYTETRDKTDILEFI